MSLVRIALLVLQPDLDWDGRDPRKIVERIGPRRGAAFLDRQNLRLADREKDVERVGLDDRRERGRSRNSDQRAEILLMVGDGAVEGSEDPRIAEVDVREVDSGLRIQDRGGRLVGR